MFINLLLFFEKKKFDFWREYNFRKEKKSFLGEKLASRKRSLFFAKNLDFDKEKLDFYKENLDFDKEKLAFVKEKLDLDGKKLDLGQRNSILTKKT